MKQITKITTLLFLLIGNVSFAQVQISRQVIGSTGGFSTGTSLTISSTVGETATQTLFSTNSILTQGFQQTMKPLDSLVKYEVINESCIGAKNGSIYVNSVLGCTGPYTLMVTLPNDSIPIGADTLSTGNYDVTITGASGCNVTINVFIGLDLDAQCDIKIYSGFTPNGDGDNDTWIIDNINLYPNNKVTIFNRWGDEVWYASAYNNNDKVFEGINKNGNDLPDGTYFYMVRINKKTYKGWVELTR